MSTDPTILGAFETVDFPDFAIVGMLAKIDTGADTGALHATNVYEAESPAGKVLHFSPFDHPEMVKTTDTYKSRLVRSSNGQAEQRYYIDTVVRIHGKEYPIHLSLADREKMTHQVLIGKRFLAEHKLLVDVGHDSQ
jgi:hypothetical protein